MFKMFKTHTSLKNYSSNILSPFDIMARDYHPLLLWQEIISLYCYVKRLSPFVGYKTSLGCLSFEITPDHIENNLMQVDSIIKKTATRNK